MNDVRKWLVDVMDERAKEDLDYGRQEVASELLDLIGRDAATDAWETIADDLVVAIEMDVRMADRLQSDLLMNCLDTYRKLKEESRG